jgi:hypothetical protein
MTWFLFVLVLLIGFRLSGHEDRIRRLERRR